MSGLPWLTMLTLTPLVGGLWLAGRRDWSPLLVRRVALGVAGVTLLMVLGLLAGFDRGSDALQFGERHAWIPALAVEYRLAKKRVLLAALEACCAGAA